VGTLRVAPYGQLLEPKDTAMRSLPDAHTDYVFTMHAPAYAIVAAVALIAGIALWIGFRYRAQT
jgi:cell division protein FtsW (lipid II flippase)